VAVDGARYNGGRQHEPLEIDLEFMEWLGENDIPFSVVFTKIDKISKGKLNENRKTYEHKMYETWEELPPILTSSTETHEGKEEILDYIHKINKLLSRK